MNWQIVLLTVLTSLTLQAAPKENRAVLSVGDEATSVLAEELQPGTENENLEIETASNKIDTPAQVAAATQNLEESQIPVLTEVKKVKEEVSPQPMKKMVLSLGVILLAILGGGIALRRWFWGKKANIPSAQIRVIAQHHLGPRRSLAIVYVAGESLLLGITDSQVNLIKQLSLIDDEVPSDLPKKFDETLSFTEATQPETGENFSMRNLKEIVSSRLRNMREI